MTAIRPERVAEMIQREVTDVLIRRFRDPRLAGVTITDVEVSGDLKHAKIFFSTLEAGETREKSFMALKRAAGALRRELAHRINLREVPEVHFEFDDSLEKGARVEEILRRIRDGEPEEEMEKE